MKKLLLRLLTANLLFISYAYVIAEPVLVSEKELEPQNVHKITTRIITRLLSNYHYKPVQLNDEFSPKILDKFVDSLDPMRLYFTVDDINSIYQRSYLFDNYLRSADLRPFFEIFKIYRQNLIQQTDYARSLLDLGFDFSIDEYVQFDRKEVARAKNKLELNELWRKRIKNEYLNIKLTGKKKESEVKETLIQRYLGLQRRTKQLNSDDVYQIAINSYTSGLDPHTTYFTPRSTENFKISMSLSLEGIGAVLQNKDEHTIIRKIVPGGPADLSGKLFPDDRIVSIGQENEENLTDVIGWRLDDVVDLIRGPKGSAVRLEVLPKNESFGGPTRIVEIVRDEIKLEEQAAKSFILSPTTLQHKIGIIQIPTFYLDFDGRKSGKSDYRSTTRDVKDLITKLENEKVAGIIVDVRGNGGGSLSEATSLTGLFIDSGPIVQIQDYTGSVEIEKDPVEGVFYSGPLVVLVDRNSASASEIFAGAIQDYNRGLIVGEATYGKGTVQNLVNLNRYTKATDNTLGQLKATMAQFFRVSGDSTQHRGVIPDINYDEMRRPEDHGERALENALPWAQIEAAAYKKLTKMTNLIPVLRNNHEERIKDDKKIQHVFKIEKKTVAAREKTELSLLKSTRKREFEQNKKDQRGLEDDFRNLHNLPPVKANPEDEPDSETENEELFDDPKYDAILMETINILADYQNLIRKQ